MSPRWRLVRRRQTAQPTYVGIRAIAADVLYLPGGRTRAVLEVGGLPFDRLDEDAQAAAIAGFAQVLDSLQHPLQILVRVSRLDLTPYLAALEARGQDELAPALRALLRGQLAHLHTLLRERILLDRRYYLVVPGDDAVDRVALPPWRRATTAPDRADLAQRQRLTFRCDELSQLLRGCALPCRRLSGAELARLLYASWCPERAARQPITALDGYLLPVIEAIHPLPRWDGGALSRADANAPAHATALRHQAPGRHQRDPDTARFVRGIRTVADLIAPDAIEHRRGWLRLDDDYTRTLALIALPPEVGPGWLDRLITWEEPLTLSIQVTPLDSAALVRAFTNRLARHQGSLALDARAERVAEPGVAIAYDQLLRLRHRLAAGEQRVFSVGFYVTLRAHTPAALDNLTARVEGLVAGLLAQSRRATYEHDSGFRSCLPTGEDTLQRASNLTTESLAAAFPFVGSGLTMAHGIVFGRAPRAHSLVILDLFAQGADNPGNFNANLAVFGKSGGGKSFFTKLFVLRSLAQAGVAAVIIDPEPREEYRPLCAALDGQYVRLAPGSDQRLNPFDLPPAEADRDPLATQVVELGGLLEVLLSDRDQPLTTRERALLDTALYATYAGAGVIPGDPATWGREPPRLGDLHTTLTATPADELGARAVALDLAQRLARWVGRGALAGLFDRPTTLAVTSPCVVFSLGDLAPELHPVAMHALAGFVWRQVRRETCAEVSRPRLLVIDEAWKLLRHEAGARLLEAFARQARKYQLGLVTSTQDVEDFLGHPQGRTVLTMASTKLLLRQDGRTLAPIAAAFGLTADEARFLRDARPGAGLLYALGTHVELQVEASAEEFALVTTTPQELAAQPAVARAVGAPAPPAQPDPPDGADGAMRRAAREAIRAQFRRTGERRR